MTLIYLSKRNIDVLILSSLSLSLSLSLARQSRTKMQCIIIYYRVNNFMMKIKQIMFIFIKVNKYYIHRFVPDTIHHQHNVSQRYFYEDVNFIVFFIRK